MQLPASAHGTPACTRTVGHAPEQSRLCPSVPPYAGTSSPPHRAQAATGVAGHEAASLRAESAMSTITGSPSAITVEERRVGPQQTSCAGSLQQLSEHSDVALDLDGAQHVQPVHGGAGAQGSPPLPHPQGAAAAQPVAAAQAWAAPGDEALDGALDSLNASLSALERLAAGADDI